MNSKYVYALAIALVLGTTGALATPGGEGNNTGCNGVGNPNSPCEGNPGNGGGGNGGDQAQLQGQLQGQAQGQQQGQQQAANADATGVGVGIGVGKGGNAEQSQESYNANLNANLNKNESNSASSAGAISGSASDSNASSFSTGGSSVVGVAVETGPTISGSESNATGGQGGDGGNAYANGGDSYARGGDADSRAYSEGSNAGAEVGDVTSRSGDSRAVAAGGESSVGDTKTGDITVEGDTDNSVVSYKNERSASSAASVYAQVCQSGGSVQGQAGGFSIVNAEPMCEHLKLAAVYQELYLWEIENGQYVCQEAMSGDAVKGMAATHSDLCVNPRAEKFYGLYIEHMDDAELLSDKTEEAGLIDKFSGYLVRPMALLGALIWLI